MGHMLEYLKRKSVWKVFKAGFKQQSFEADLVAKIETVTKARDDFNEESELCHKEVIQKMGEDSTRTGDGVATLAKVLDVSNSEQQRSNRAIIDCLKSFDQSFMSLAQEVYEMRKNVTSMTCRMKPIANFLELLCANPRAWENVAQMNKPLDEPDRTGDTRITRRSSIVDVVKKRGRRTASLKQTALLPKLDYNPKVTGADTATNCRVGHDLSKDDQERSLHVIKSKKLADWVEKDGSAMSFVCARLVYALNEIRCGRQSAMSSGHIARPDIVPLHFFCGQHLSLNESWQSPSGVVNSLLAQLLTHCNDINLTNLAKADLDFDNSNIYDMLSLFKTVLKQLPADTTVFCVLDAISNYADMKDTSQDAEALITGLAKIASKPSRRKRPVFKLLLTAPNRLRTPLVNFSPGWLDSAQVPNTLRNTGGFTAAKWSLGVGQKLAEIATVQ